MEHFYGLPGKFFEVFTLQCLILGEQIGRERDDVSALFRLFNVRYLSSAGPKIFYVFIRVPEASVVK